MKPIFSACALLICSTLAQAQTTNWTFSYTGFYDREAAAFLPDAQLQGSFSGFDVNADGVLERSELTSLLVGGTDYIACAATSNSYASCGASSFSFSQGGGLAFSLGAFGSDPEGWVSGGHTITTGDSDFTWHYDPSSSMEHHLDWNAGTRLSLTNDAEVGGVGAIQLGSIPAVPEASHWAMLLAGLAGIGALRMARKRAG